MNTHTDKANYYTEDLFYEEDDVVEPPEECEGKYAFHFKVMF